MRCARVCGWMNGWRAIAITVYACAWHLRMDWQVTAAGCIAKGAMGRQGGRVCARGGVDAVTHVHVGIVPQLREIAKEGTAQSKETVTRLEAARQEWCVRACCCWCHSRCEALQLTAVAVWLWSTAKRPPLLG